MSASKVLAKDPLGKESVSDALSQDWFALNRRMLPGALAVQVGAKGRKTVDAAITKQHLPELHTVLNSLLVDPAALLNTFLLFGGCFVPVEPGACDDNAAISGMLRAVQEYFERMKDGVRDHQDTLALAELFQPLVPAMLCVIREAAAMRGGVA